MPAADQSPRSHYGVNSPKGQGGSQWKPTNKFGWGGAGQSSSSDTTKPAGNNALASLVTQVSPEEAERLKQQHRTAGAQTTGAEAGATETSTTQKECVCCRSCWSCIFGRDSGQTSSSWNTGTHTTSHQHQNIEAVPVTAPEKEETPSEETPEGLLGPQTADCRGLKTLVLDLDETLVHSSFQEIDCTFHVPIEIEGQRHEVYVLKRPFVDEFLVECAKHYEIVVFTASLGQYANPVLDELDTYRVIKHRLFRESCVLHNGSAYVKDLSRLGRREKNSIIIDNSPLSYLFHPRNAIGCESWFGNTEDTELRDLIPVLATTLKECDDVRDILNANTQTLQWLCNQAKPQATTGRVSG